MRTKFVLLVVIAFSVAHYSTVAHADEAVADDDDVTVADDDGQLVDSEKTAEDCGCSKLSRNAQTEPSSDTQATADGDSSLHSRTDGESEQKQPVVDYPRTNQMVYIEGRKTSIGTDEPQIMADGEHPKRTVYVNSFYLDVHEVSNAEFELFVKATGYVTEVISYLCSKF